MMSTTVLSTFVNYQMKKLEKVLKFLKFFAAVIQSCQKRFHFSMFGFWILFVDLKKSPKTLCGNLAKNVSFSQAVSLLFYNLPSA